MVKKPYVKKFGKISKFIVWIVDGNYIRKNIDEEFTNFGQYYRFNFIPKNEFWIDKGGRTGEENFFIDHMLVEQRLMEKGESYSDALDEANLSEKSERNKSKLMKKFYKEKCDQEKILKNIHLRLLTKYSNKKIKIWIVNGELVRSLYFSDFTQGGHDLVYSFVPENEIWIDDDTAVKERKFIILHELHERNLMAKGMGYGPAFLTKEWKKHGVHNSAHKSASQIEYYCRHHPEETDYKLKIELKKAKKN